MAVSVAEVRERAARLVNRDHRAWAAGMGEAPRLSVSLHVPTEKQVLSDIAGAQEWAAEWRRAEERLPVRVEWAERSWPSVGTQRVPVRVTVEGADVIAEVGGPDTRRTWTRARDRARCVRDCLGDRDDLRPVLRQHGRALSALTEEDFETLLMVVAWLVRHPASGLRVRQLPIRGIHTKWLEGNLTLVGALHNAVTGRESLGLRTKEDMVRVRFLDDGLAAGAPRDLAAPSAELAALDVDPDYVIVLENLETLLSLPERIPGVVAVFGGGNAVVSRLKGIGWVMRTPIVYWGDLDTYGFEILGRLRAVHADVRSVLMDEGTLEQCRDLWGQERSPVRGRIENLTPVEESALLRLEDEGNVRLEQERVPWAYALDALLPAVGQRCS